MIFLRHILFLPALSLAIVATTCISAHAEMISDPLEVLSTAATPQKCISKNIDNTKMTLSALIEVALCNNPKLNRSYMEAKSSAAALGQSKSEYLPSIDAGADISYSHTKTGGGNNDGTSNNSNIGADISLNWLLYDFGNRENSVEIAKQKLEYANFSRNQVLQDTVFAVAKAFFTLLSARETLDSATVNEETYLKSYDIASKKHELGLVSLSDKLQAETSYAQSQLTTTKAMQSMEEARGNLAVLLNLPPFTDIDLADTELKYEDGLFKSEVKDLITEALANRPDLKAQKASTESARLAVKTAELDNMPSISLGSGVSANDKFSGDKSHSYGGNIGITLNVPLFTGFSNTYNTLSKRYDYQSAKNKTAEKQNEISTDVWTTYQAYQTMVKNYEITEKLFASASENYRVALGAYKAGKGNIIDLLEAQYQLAEARMEKSSSLYNLLLAKNDLLRAIGKMEI